MLRSGDERPLGGFPATRHSALAAIRSGNEEQRRRALDVVAEAYWRPVYSYLRLQWRKPHDEAADLTQEFFTHLLGKDLLSRFDPRRSRLRTFLRSCIDGLVANEHRAQGRLKRGGERHATFDFEEVRAAVERLHSPALSPEERFEQEWARGLFTAALDRLRRDCEREGRAPHFELFEQHELSEGPGRPSYAGLAKRFRISTSDVTNRLAGIRRRLRATVLELLRESTASEAEFRAEARALFGKDPP
jgi:RNA polymerase sigma factor (sigma-70 family)